MSAPEPGFSKEQLERAEVMNRINLLKAGCDAGQQQQADYQKLLDEKAALEVKLAETILHGTRGQLSPHRIYMAEVYWDTTEKQYVCKLPYEPADDEAIENPIFAYGDTPAQACDNFDNLWIYGAPNA